jgi:Putative polyhydroxyalkanoic acid system protein (PHA_gran_rgn)
LSDIVVRWRHELDVARARRLAETVAGHLGDDFGVSSAWDGDTLLKRQRSSA